MKLGLSGIVLPLGYATARVMKLHPKARADIRLSEEDGTRFVRRSNRLGRLLGCRQFPFSPIQQSVRTQMPFRLGNRRGQHLQGFLERRLGGSERHRLARIGLALHKQEISFFRGRERLRSLMQYLAALL